jgi:hypothetical protein
LENTLGREGKGLGSFEACVDPCSPRLGDFKSSLSHDFNGWKAKSPKGMREGDGRDRARLKDELEVKTGFHRGQNPYIPLKSGVSG